MGRGSLLVAAVAVGGGAAFPAALGARGKRGIYLGMIGAGAEQRLEILLEAPGKRELAIETVVASDGVVQVSVTDSGAGLAPEVRAHLFQPFVTTKQKGMGLGLSICRTIVEAHGGKIWVESRPQGGTIFRFTLRVPGESEEAELGQ